MAVSGPCSYGFPPPVIDKHYFLPEIKFPRSTSLSAGQLVCIARDYEPTPEGTHRVGPPLAVGRMTLPSVSVKRSTKGKFLTLLHAWKDELWKMGGEERPPRPRLLQGNLNMEEEEEGVEAAPVIPRKRTGGGGTRRKRPQRGSYSRWMSETCRSNVAEVPEAAPMVLVQRKRTRGRGTRKVNQQQGNYFLWVSETCR